MPTVIVQIGNSDDKLSQSNWAAFIADTATLITKSAECIYFSGFSAPTASWQNACWVFEMKIDKEAELRSGLCMLCEAYAQDSIALTSSATEFLSFVHPGG